MAFRHPDVKLNGLGDDRNDIGPKVSGAELDKVDRITEDAIAAGAVPLLRGGRPDTPPVAGGHWLLPTMLGDVTVDMVITRDEIFGPVVPVMRITSFDQALGIANDSRYYLLAYLLTNDFNRIMRAVQDVRFGEIYINRIGREALQQYHTGYGNSGPGGDDGIHGLDAYLRKKTVYANYSGVSPVGLMPWDGR